MCSSGPGGWARCCSTPLHSTPLHSNSTETTGYLKCIKQSKAGRRKIKLRTLKLPALKLRLRLHRGGTQPVALWGIEGQGLAPRYRTALRHAMAKRLGHHTGGLPHSAFDLRSHKYMDPGDQVILHHIRAYHLVQAWPQTSPHILSNPGPTRTSSFKQSNTLGTLSDDRWQPPLACVPPDQ